MNYNHYNFPERSLDPPEDSRRVYGICVLCGEEILEGDDCYYIEGLGLCCEVCIEDSKLREVEVDD